MVRVSKSTEKIYLWIFGSQVGPECIVPEEWKFKVLTSGYCTCCLKETYFINSWRENMNQNRIGAVNAGFTDMNKSSQIQDISFSDDAFDHKKEHSLNELNLKSQCTLNLIIFSPIMLCCFRKCCRKFIFLLMTPYFPTFLQGLHS